MEKFEAGNRVKNPDTGNTGEVVEVISREDKTVIRIIWDNAPRLLQKIDSEYQKSLLDRLTAVKD